MRLLRSSRCVGMELDYARAWRDVAELGRIGLECNVRVISRGVQHVHVASISALEAELSRAKLTYRQRNLYCGFRLDGVPVNRLAEMLQRALSIGDRILGDETMFVEPHERWS